MDHYYAHVIAALGLFLIALALAPTPARSQTTSVTLPNRPCFTVEDMELDGVRVTPVIRDTQDFGWVLLHDTVGEKPDALAFLVKRDGVDLVCIIAQAPGKNT